MQYTKFSLPQTGRKDRSPGQRSFRLAGAPGDARRCTSDSTVAAVGHADHPFPPRAALASDRSATDSALWCTALSTLAVLGRDVPSNPDPLLLAFGLEVRRRRDALGWSLDVLAGRTGLSRTMLIGIEHGRRNPSLKTLVAVANALEVSPAEMLAAALPRA